MRPGSSTAPPRRRQRRTAQRPTSSRKSPTAEPASATTARLVPQGRHRTAGAAAPRSSRAQASRRPESVELRADAGPRGNGSIPADRDRPGPERPHACAAAAARTARLLRGTRIAALRASTRPRLTAATQAPAAGPRREATACTARAGTRSKGHLHGEPQQRQSQVVHWPCSFRICSRRVRSSAVSLRCSTRRQSSWARDPRKTRWTSSPSSLPDTSSYDRAAR